MITSTNEIALDSGFAEGFLETTRAYFEQEASALVSDAQVPTDHEEAPLPVIERGSGPRAMLHVLSPDSI